MRIADENLFYKNIEMGNIFMTLLFQIVAKAE